MTSDLSSLLAAGERAVFHGSPAAAVEALDPAVRTARDLGRTAEAGAAAWLLGVALAALGRYGDALAVQLDLLARGEQPGAAPEVRMVGALAGAAAAAVHRAVGGHAEARRLDERGLALAPGSDDAAFDCLLGLASDAVGAADPDRVRTCLAEAESLLAGHPEWWRQQVRAGWVRTELALLVGDAGAAVAEAGAAVALAERSRAPRHVAKGLLFLAVAQLDVDEQAALTTLHRAVVLAEGLGAVPVAWAARALLGTLLRGAEAAGAQECLRAAAAGARQIAAGLPEDLRVAWLSRPDVAAVMSTAPPA